MKLALPAFLSVDNASTDTRFGQRSNMLEYDQALLWVTALLLLLGLVMMYSASLVLPDSPK